MIDAHLHLGSVPISGKEWGNFEEYKKIALKSGIRKYCVTPIGKPEDFANKTTPDNEAVLKEAEKDKKIIPVYWFNIFDLPELIDKRYKAIKFHPDIGEVDISDQRVMDFVKKANLPVFVHTNENKPYSSLQKAADLARIVKAPVIAVHSGSVTKAIFTLPKYSFPENIYFETSGIQYALLLKEIHALFGSDRIIFGSDYPFGDPKVALAMIRTLPVKSKDIEKITQKNIERILSIS